MPEPRSYCIGLPVVFTVHDDGRVEVTVDVSEAADDLEEGCPTDETGTPEYSEAQVLADAETIRAATPRAYTPPITLLPVPKENPDA